MLERPLKRVSYRFDQLADQINDRVMPDEVDVDRYVGLEHLDPDSLRIRRWGDTSEVESTKLLFQPGDIIFGKRRVYQRKVAVADFQGICSAHAMVLRAKPETVLPEFLPFFMQSDLFMERALRISVGSLSPTINWEALAKEEFLLPPIQEQARVVEAIGAVSTTREELIELRTAAETLSESLSYSLFSTVISPVGREIKEIFDQVIDRGYDSLPILSVTIDGNIVRRDELERHVSDDTGSEKYLRVQPGDIAYNTMRLWQGAVGVAREEGLISPAYTVMRPKSKNIDVEMFIYLFRSKRMQREYRKLVTGVASDRWRLYFKDLSRVRLRLPETTVQLEQWSSLRSISAQSVTIDRRLADATAVLKMLHMSCFSE